MNARDRHFQWDSVNAFWLENYANDLKNNGKTLLHTIYYARNPFIVHITYSPLFYIDATLSYIYIFFLVLFLQNIFISFEGKHYIGAAATSQKKWMCMSARVYWYYNKKRIIFSHFHCSFCLFA